MKSSEHTGSQRTVHNREATKSHNERAIDTAKQRRNDCSSHRPQRNVLRTLEHLSAITSPFRKKIGLGAVRFNSLNHHQAVHRSTVFLAGVLLNLHVKVSQVPAQSKEDDKINARKKNADKG